MCNSGLNCSDSANILTGCLLFQFVTRAVRVIDLITNIDMQAFQTHGGLSSFINRLEVCVTVGLLIHMMHVQ